MKEIIFFVLKHSKKYFKTFTWIILCILFVQAISLVSPMISGLIIDNFFKGLDLGYVGKLLALLLILGIVGRLIHLFKERLDINKFFFDFARDTQIQASEKMLSFSMGQHLTKNSGIKDTIMSKGVSSVRSIIQVIVYDFLPFFLKTLVVLIGLFVIDIHFGLVGLFGFSLIAFLQNRIIKKHIPYLSSLEKKSQKRSQGSWEILRNIALVKNSGRESFALSHVDDLILKENTQAKSIWSSLMTRLILSGTLIQFFSVTMLFVAAVKIYYGDLTPGTFLVVGAWSGMLFSEIGILQGIYRVFAMNTPAILEFQEFLNQKPDITEPRNPVVPDIFKGSIEFKNVSFVYPDEESGERVLDDVSFHIQPKETIGVVGRSGSGKSTFIKLLLRNYDPDKGQIRIDGEDLRVLKRSHYLESVGYVEQSPQLFDMTIRENLAFASSRSFKEDDFEKALRQAGLWDFVEKLPKGLDTEIGEQGVKLSGGQRQRLAIARALIKKPALLILDEATASLDTEKEREIQEAIDNLAKENISATKIVIAHRLSTIVNADRIFVFDEGRIVDVGNHLELLQRCEIYKTLHNLQHMHVA